MVIGIHSSKEQFINSLEHEIRHLVDDIASVFSLDSEGEPVAYLTGYINQKISLDIEMFMCGCQKCQSHLQNQVY